MISTLIAPVLGIADKVLERVIPDPEQKHKAKLEFANQLARLNQEDKKEFHDFIVAYEGTGEKVHPIIQVLRGSVRPVITYFLVAVYAYGFLNPGDFDASIMQGLFQLNLISLGFWYGERALKNLGLDMGKKKA